MQFGAGTVIARKFGARKIVDPRALAVGSIAETYRTYPAIGLLLPAMGYSDQQVRDLEATINRKSIGVPTTTTSHGTSEKSQLVSCAYHRLSDRHQPTGIRSKVFDRGGTQRAVHAQRIKPVRADWGSGRRQPRSIPRS